MINEVDPVNVTSYGANVGNQYYRATRNHTFLEHEEVLELSRRWHKYNDYDARNTIVLHYLRLSMKMASYYSGRGVDYDDLVQEGNIGLMVAANKFDPERGSSFYSYATWWVRNHITRSIENHKDIIRLSVYSQSYLNKLLRIKYRLKKQLQRDPSLEEIAAVAGIDVSKVDKILHQQRVMVVSMEELAYSNSSQNCETTIGDLVIDRTFPSAVTALEAKDDLEMALIRIEDFTRKVNKLPVSEKAKKSFKMYYGLEGHRDDHTLESIVETSNIGVSTERVRQLVMQVWQKIYQNRIEMSEQKLISEIKSIQDIRNIVDSN